MKLTNGKEIIVLYDEVQIKAFKNNGWEEVVPARKRKANANIDKD